MSVDSSSQSSFNTSHENKDGNKTVKIASRSQSESNQAHFSSAAMSDKQGSSSSEFSQGNILDDDDGVEIDIETGQECPPVQGKDKKTKPKIKRSQTAKNIQFSCPTTLNQNNLFDDSPRERLTNDSVLPHTQTEPTYKRQLSDSVTIKDPAEFDPLPRRATNSALDTAAVPRESPHRYSRFKRFIKSLSNKPESQLNFYKPPPPPDDDRKTLVLDMDETLIHCSAFPPHPDVNYFKLSETEFVYTRPGLQDFLQYCLTHFEVFIYTFAERDYAEQVLDQIAPTIDEDHRLYRDSCIVKKNFIIKDLDMLNRSKSKLVFVDDNDKALKFNKENTIVIPMWKGMPNDHALLEWLLPLLEMCRNSTDTRTVIKQIKNKNRRFTCY